MSMALRKQTFDLAFFTDGAMPEGFMTVPGHDQQQRSQMEQDFNLAYAGNDQTRRHIRFMPNGVGSPIPGRTR